MTIAVPTAERAGDQKYSPTSTRKLIGCLLSLPVPTALWFAPLSVGPCCRANGAENSSPGQRPGAYRAHQAFSALKGRRDSLRPFRAHDNQLIPETQAGDPSFHGVAKGWESLLLAV